MIFNNNTTVLGPSTIPMAEGYDCSYGTALALIESAKNDRVMFEAMLNIEAQELNIRNSSNGYVAEGQIQALAEASLSGIWNKIKELLKKFIAKIKAIIHNFVAKIQSLFMKDKEFVKKYSNEVRRKDGIENLEVKWRKVKKSPLTETIETVSDNPDFGKDSGKWDEDREKRISKYLDGKDFDDYEEYLMGVFFEDDEPNTYQIKEIGGITNITTYLEGYGKKAQEQEKAANKFSSKIESYVNKFNKMANEKVTKEKELNDSESADDTTKTHATALVTVANHAYDMALAYQEAHLKKNQIILDAIKIEYKQNKAAFVKAVSANPDKLKESAILLDAIAEAAEDEVEDVIDGAINAVDTFEDSCDSTENVKDADVKNDADDVEGYESELVAENEAAFFAAMIY
jgi:hypothetical protein